MDGWNAGQIFQLYQLQDKGKDWYCSTSDGEYAQIADSGAPRASLCMLVRYAEDGYIKTGVETIEKDNNCPVPNGRKPVEFFTTIANIRLQRLRRKPLE